MWQIESSAKKPPLIKIGGPCIECTVERAGNVDTEKLTWERLENGRKCKMKTKK